MRLDVGWPNYIVEVAGRVYPEGLGGNLSTGVVEISHTEYLSWNVHTQRPRDEQVFPEQPSLTYPLRSCLRLCSVSFASRTKMRISNMLLISSSQNMRNPSTMTKIVSDRSSEAFTRALYSETLDAASNLQKR